MQNDIFATSAGTRADRDVRACAAHGWSGPDGLRDVVYFVAATVGVQFATVERRLAAIRSHHWGGVRNASTVRRTTEYVDAHARSLYDALVANPTRVDAVESLLDVPGLDTVKAGFVAQLLGYDVGCLDVHNLRRFNLNANAFTASALKTRERRREKIAHYADVCDRCGGSLRLWADWCDLIARRYPQQFADGADVSTRHVTACRAG